MQSTHEQLPREWKKGLLFADRVKRGDAAEAPAEAVDRCWGSRGGHYAMPHSWPLHSATASSAAGAGARVSLREEGVRCMYTVSVRLRASSTRTSVGKRDGVARVLSRHTVVCGVWLAVASSLIVVSGDEVGPTRRDPRMLFTTT